MRLTDIPIARRLGAMVTLGVCGVGAVALLMEASARPVRVGGGLFDAVVEGKDLVADVLPPPNYIIETYLIAHQLVARPGSAEGPALRERLGDLRREYDDRHAHWVASLPPGPLREAKVERSHAPALRLFAALDDSLLPALAAGRVAAAAAALHGPVHDAYTEHRLAVDDVVRLAEARNDSVTAAGQRRIRVAGALSLVGALGLGAVLVLAGRAIALSITAPLDTVTHALDAVAEGRYDLTIAVDDASETGRLGRSLAHTVGVLRAGVAERARRTADDEARLAREREAVRAVLAEVEALLAVVEGAAAGDFTRPVPTPDDPALRRMAEGLRGLIHDLGGRLGGIRGHADALGEAAALLAGTVASLHGALDATAGRTTEVAHEARRASEGTETLAAAVEEMHAAANEIATSVQGVAAGAADAVGRTRTAEDTMRRLQRSATSIGEVLGLIRSIAEQINLLALNATIEAARAGEAGRGFAVVAGEVKALAGRTAEATQTIEERLGGIARDADEVGGAIRAIGEVVATVQDGAASIAGAVEEQAATTREMARSVAEAASGVRGISDAAATVATAAADGTASVAQVSGAADGVAGMARELHDLVAHFRLGPGAGRGALAGAGR